MANRYTYQFNGSFKPKMSQIEGFVSIGTGGQINFPDQLGVGVPSGGSVSTGLPRGLLPGQATAGVPTGWLGGFSGVIGMLGAGIDGVQRVSTGLYALHLQDDWVRLDSVQVNAFNPGTAVDWFIKEHTVGLGNSIATGALTTLQLAGNNPKNEIWIQFTSGASALPQDLQSGGGFFLDLRLRDTTAGPQ